MDLSNLENILINEPAYRKKQGKQAIFKNLIEDWQDATFFSKDLRNRLNEEASLLIKADILVSEGKDSIKARIELKDKLLVESVLMMHEDGRNTVCVSSQVGCALGCEFCATGKMGFKRNLTDLEIVEQVIFFARYLKGNGRVDNVVFMGMGEPFLNYDNVLQAIRILNDKEGLNIGARSISVSSVGITEGIEKLAKEKIQANLAVSLHAPNNELRSKLMPINKKYPLEDVLKSVDKYIKETNRQVMFEYLLIQGVNDSDKCAKELSAILKKPLYFLNLITYNSIENSKFKPSQALRVKGFKAVLDKNKIKFSQRHRFGQDIKAACGQFATSKLK